MVEPRLEVIEGQKVLVVERRPPLPRSLPALLSLMTDVWVRKDIRPTGARAECEAYNLHRFETLREGSAVLTDGLRRDLRVEMCADCGACCIRDISRDRLAGLPTGGQALRRRDLVLGWYTGARRNRREYR